MAHESSREELERKLEQTRRLAVRTTDTITRQTLLDFAEELRQKFQGTTWSRRKSSNTEERIRARAHEVWEQNGRPTGRDLEFWLLAEREIKERSDLATRAVKTEGISY
jgi:hypothetical protein